MHLRKDLFLCFFLRNHLICLIACHQKKAKMHLGPTAPCDLILLHLDPPDARPKPADVMCFHFFSFLFFSKLSLVPRPTVPSGSHLSLCQRHAHPQHGHRGGGSRGRRPGETKSRICVLRYWKFVFKSHETWKSEYLLF